MDDRDPFEEYAEPKGPVDKSSLDPESLQFRVLTLLEKGNKIQAIKLLREEMGVGLKEAKDAVDKISREYGLEGSQSGCVLVVAAGMILSCVVLGLYFA